jgi:hypothetical protein
LVKGFRGKDYNRKRLVDKRVQLVKNGMEFTGESRIAAQYLFRCHQTVIYSTNYNIVLFRLNKILLLTKGEMQLTKNREKWGF